MAAALAAATACASAGKRLEQGLDLEARGDWYGAALRYADALEKDPRMEEARRGLYVAGDSAIVQGMHRADERAAAGDPVGGGDQVRRLDALLARGRSVGASIPVPDTYDAVRRDAFDAAVDQLMEDADALRAEARWSDAREDYLRIRRDFEPSAEQSRSSLDAEADLLVAWAGADADDGRFRSAYERAEEALALPAPIPREVADAATDLQERSLVNGLRVLAVFPVGSTAEVRAAAEADLEGQLSDVLELDHWRRPPLFVAVADPVVVRQTTRRLLPPGTPFRPGRVLDAIGADFGALVELTRLEATEHDVTSSARTTRTRQGRPASYSVEQGQVRYAIEATITFFDERGVQIGSATARANEAGRFERGVYRGDPRDLELSRGEQLLFDLAAQRQRRAEIETRLLSELAANVADDVFREVVRRIP